MTWLRRNGGLRDDGGELSAMDLARSGGRFQQGNLVNPRGMSLDDAAQRAYQAGLFPDVPRPGGAGVADNYNPVTPDMLLEAIRREHMAGRRGAGDYTPAAQDDWRATQDLNDHPAARYDPVDPLEANARFGDGYEPVPVGRVPGAPRPTGEPLFTTEPTARTWDYVKRALDDVVEGYRDPTTRRLNLDENGRSVVSTLKELRAELVQLNPAYGRALARSGEYLSAYEAFQSGAKLLMNTRISERKFGEMLSGMTDGQRDAFKGGIANHYFDLAQNGRLDPKVLKAPRIRAKLEMAFGKNEAGALIKSAEQEAKMLALERRYAPGANSITQEMAAAMKEQDGASGLQSMGADFGARVLQGQGLRGSLLGSMASGVRKLGAVGKTGGMPVAARDEAGRLLLMPPEDFRRHMALTPRPKSRFGGGVPRPSLYGAGLGGILAQP
jgi:hypothetical protein